MNYGAFVCSCGGTCDIDLEAVRDGVDEVDVVASSERLCEDGLGPMEQVIEEYELDQLVVTTPEEGCQRRIRALADELGLHPAATEFVDHREGAAWVHERDAATDKVSRLLDARVAGLREETVSRTVGADVGEDVLVVGDAGTAAALADTADVTLLSDGTGFDDADLEGLEGVSLARGDVVHIDGRIGEFEVTVETRVTDDCISCLDCVEEMPEHTTAMPVEVDRDAPRTDWTDVCPTDAIELDGVRKTLTASQVVYPAAPAPSRGGQVGLYTGPVDAGTVAAVESRLGGFEKPAFLDLEMEVCAAGDASQEGCTACVDACPHEAVERPAIDEVAFDEVSCQNCGACTSACPTGATSLREPSNERLAREVEALLDGDGGDDGLLPWGEDGGIDTEVVAFVCSERAADRLRAYGRRAARGEDVTYPPVLPVSVNCTDTVGEAHVVHALAAGADGVAIVGCGGDCLHSGPDPKAELVDRLNTATSDLGLGERVTFVAPDADDPGRFVEELSRFYVELEDSPVPAGDHEATGKVDDEQPNPAFNSHEWTLESVRAVLDHVTPEREVIRGLADFGVLTVSDACNLTPTCTNLCPTNAIRRTDEGDLRFNHERCVNCGLCEEGCPETAIEMEPGLDLGRLPENRDGEAWETVFEGEMLECVRCGEPFTSAGTADTIQDEVGDLVEGIAPESEHSIFEYCGDCRARLLFNRGETR